MIFHGISKQIGTSKSLQEAWQSEATGAGTPAQEQCKLHACVRALSGEKGEGGRNGARGVGGDKQALVLVVGGHLGGGVGKDPHYVGAVALPERQEALLSAPPSTQGPLSL